MIEAQSLSKRYGTLTAIENVTFKAEKGDVLGFLGPNGAGKTTTMRIITGFMPASDGHAKVAGFDVFDNPKEIKKRIGYLPERPPLYRDMLVDKYLDFVAELKGLNGAQRKTAVKKAADSCGLGDVLDRVAGHLSKGYQQRLGIAQAIVNDPEVLVLDEPTIGLDPKQIVEMREMIRHLAGNRTVILSSHILSEVSQICNRIVIINRGKIIAHDSIDSLKKSLGSSERVRVRVRSKDASVEAALKSLPGFKSLLREDDSWIVTAEQGSKAAEKIAKMTLDKGWGFEEVANLELSLEDVFLQFVEKDEAARKAAAPQPEPKESAGGGE